MKPDKRDYLFKMIFSCKDYQNYIITAIWHKLNIDIKPITNQYVKTSDGEYYLIDLYFPQINLGVKIEEKDNKKNTELDVIKDLPIQAMLSAIEDTNLMLLRVCAYKSIEEINKNIDEVVQVINKQIGNIKPWVMDEDVPKKTIDIGFIDANECVQFKTINEVCKCFNKKYKLFQGSYFKIVNEYYLWCPKLSTKSKKLAFGWVNVLAKDWNHIIEYNMDPSKQKPTSKSAKRIVFVKTNDHFGGEFFRFVGVFEYYTSKYNKRIYKRVATKINLDKFFK